MRGFLHMVFAIVAGVAAGWISAVSLIENYGFEVAAGQPQWRERRNAGDHPAAPYAFGYFINQGQVPPPLTSRHFVRNTDDDGAQFRGDCTYEVAGKMPPARRWSMAISTGDGTVATLGAGETVFEPDGSVKVELSSHPVPGNRMALPGNGIAILSLTIHDPAESETPLSLPGVKRVRC
ncbi:MAG: hypothetical protein GYA66_03025 [Phyllobacteriaceae bacterium]|jgi:hypothetical protein|nr:hypothetical protein [Phyllobacteriaceae bacterium]